MAKQPILIECPTCKGRGKTELPEELAVTFAHFKSKVRLTAADLVGKLEADISTTGINNRLEKLRLAGFLMRSKKGRAWRYERAPMGTPA